MRPRYEKKEDLINEDGVAKVFCLHMNCTYKKVREIDDYSPDVSFYRDDKRVAVGEIKCRTCDHEEYGTYLISAAKLDGIMSRWTPIPIVLIVRWTDGIYWVAVTERAASSWKKALGGRTDRDDPKDVEACYRIPISQFTMLKMT